MENAGGLCEMLGGSRLRVLIVDPDAAMRELIRSALAELPFVEIVGECADGPTAIESIAADRPDIVFMEIALPGVDGFDLLAGIRPVARPDVVVVTARGEHSLRAFEIHALDFMVKPCDAPRLRRPVERLWYRIRLIEQDDVRRLLSGDVSESDVPPARVPGRSGWARRIMVSDDQRFSFVAVHQIDWFEASGNVVLLHIGTEVRRARTSLRHLTAVLDPREFVRIHRSAIVRIDRIREVQRWFGGDFVVLLRDGQKLRMSRTYARQLLRIIR